MTMTRALRFTTLLVALLALALPAAAHPVVPASSSGTLVANAFSGCVASNCNVLGIGVDAGVAHTIVHTVSASHSSGFPPAYNFYLRVSGPAGLLPIAGCPDIFTPGSAGQTQVCTLPPQTTAVKVVGVFEALRPHMTGTVGYNHALTAF